MEFKWRTTKERGELKKKRKTRREPRKKIKIVNQVEDGPDEDDEGPDLEGPAVGDWAGLVGWLAG